MKWRLSLYVIITCILASISFVQAEEKDEKAQLREEIKLLKQQIEQQQKQIQALETRLTTLETETVTEGKVAEVTTASHEAKKSAELAQSLAQKTMDTYEKVIGAYSEDNLPYYITKAFQFHGYLRSGAGINGKGGKQVPFQAPGADAKYRLGNETETYGELDFIHNFVTKPDVPFFDVEVRLAYHTEEHMSDDPAHDRFSVREAYVEAGNFKFSPSVKFWAGERFYRRLDIHINDFYTFDMSGYGGGVEDIPFFIGDSKLSVAYLGGSNDTYEFGDVGFINKNSLDIRIGDLNVPLGKGMIWIVPSYVKGGTYTTEDINGNEIEQDYPSTSGASAGFVHQHDLPMDGYNRATIQYGQGTGSNFSPGVQDPTDTLGKAWAFRATDSAVIQFNKRFSLMGDVIYQLKDNGENSDAKLTWISAGVRPEYMLTENFALAFEAGADYVDNQQEDYDGILYKLTIAPTVKFNFLFFSRPEIRAYLTYATWGNGFKGMVGGTPYEDDTAGLAAGLQAEAWW